MDRESKKQQSLATNPNERVNGGCVRLKMMTNGGNLENQVSKKNGKQSLKKSSLGKANNLPKGDKKETSESSAHSELEEPTPSTATAWDGAGDHFDFLQRPKTSARPALERRQEFPTRRLGKRQPPK